MTRARLKSAILGLIVLILLAVTLGVPTPRPGGIAELRSVAQRLGAPVEARLIGTSVLPVYCASGTWHGPEIEYRYDSPLSDDQVRSHYQDAADAQGWSKPEVSLSTEAHGEAGLRTETKEAYVEIMFRDVESGHYRLRLVRKSGRWCSIFQ